MIQNISNMFAFFVILQLSLGLFTSALQGETALNETATHLSSKSFNPNHLNRRGQIFVRRKCLNSNQHTGSSSEQKIVLGETNDDVLGESSIKPPTLTSIGSTSSNDTQHLGDSNSEYETTETLASSNQGIFDNAKSQDQTEIRYDLMPIIFPALLIAAFVLILFYLAVKSSSAISSIDDNDSLNPQSIHVNSNVEMSSIQDIELGNGSKEEGKISNSLNFYDKSFTPVYQKHNTLDVMTNENCSALQDLEEFEMVEDCNLQKEIDTLKLRIDEDLRSVTIKEVCIYIQFSFIKIQRKDAFTLERIKNDFQLKMSMREKRACP